MPKILYLITQNEAGGAQKYVAQLSVDNAQNNEIAVAAGGRPEGELFAWLKSMGIKTIYLAKMERELSLINDCLAVKELIRLIKQEQPNIIHLNSTKMGVLGALAAKLAGSDAKIIFTVHGFILNEPLNIFKKIFYWLAELFSFSLTDKIICVSEFDRQSILRAQLGNEKKLITIHNGIDLAEAERLPTNIDDEKIKKIAENLKTANSQDNQPALIVGTVANFYPTKGLSYFIEAIRILKQEEKLPVAGLIIGDGQLRPELEKLIAETGLAKNLILTGALPHADQYLKYFDVYCCSSVKEGFPYSLLEALAAGLPIVSAKTGGIPEIIQDGVNGLLAETKNAADLADKIKQLIKDRSWRDNLAKQAQKTAANFNQELMLKKTNAVYQSLV